MNSLILKTFSDSGCFAHLVGDARTRRALLVDPKAGKLAVYEKALRDYDLVPVAVLDTHTHADHVSDSATWLRRGVPLWMGARTTCARRHQKLGDGDELAIGDLKFRALDVPGHTPDSVALAGHGIVLTGDTLFAGGLARADFRGSDPARLWDSVQRRLMSLPDATVVLPGHGYRDILFTTIGHERNNNPDLRHTSAAAYATALAAVEGAGNSPDVDATLALNVAAEPQLPAGPVAVAACCSMGTPAVAGPKIRESKCEELAPRRDELVARRAWIDVRDPWEWKAGHIPGVPNFPLSELGLHLEELRRLAPSVISCKSGGRSMTAAKTLAYLGVLKDPISMAGGFGRWEELALPIEH